MRPLPPGQIINLATRIKDKIDYNALGNKLPLEHFPIVDYEPLEAYPEFLGYSITKESQYRLIAEQGISIHSLQFLYVLNQVRKSHHSSVYKGHTPKSQNRLKNYLAKNKPTEKGYHVGLKLAKTIWYVLLYYRNPVDYTNYFFSTPAVKATPTMYTYHAVFKSQLFTISLPSRIKKFYMPKANKINVLNAICEPYFYHINEEKYFFLPVAEKKFSLRFERAYDITKLLWLEMDWPEWLPYLFFSTSIIDQNQDIPLFHKIKLMLEPVNGVYRVNPIMKPNVFYPEIDEEDLIEEMLHDDLLY